MIRNILIRGSNWYVQDLNVQHNDVVMFVHGHPFDHTMWKYQLDEFSNYRLLLPDLRGYGVTQGPKTDKIFIEEQVLDIALLLDSLHISKVHLVGLSMGGQISIEFHRLFPQRVTSLVICASLPNAETKESYANRIELTETIQQIGMLEYTKRDIHKYLNVERLGEQSDKLSHLFKMMSETSVHGAVASHRGRAERRDNFDHLKNIQVPVLAIVGDKDFFVDVKEMKEMTKEICHARFEVLEGVGHLPNMESVIVFNRLLKQFYKEIIL